MEPIFDQTFPLFIILEVVSLSVCSIVFHAAMRLIEFSIQTRQSFWSRLFLDLIDSANYCLAWGMTMTEVMYISFHETSICVCYEPWLSHVCNEGTPIPPRPLIFASGRSVTAWYDYEYYDPPVASTFWGSVSSGMLKMLYLGEGWYFRLILSSSMWLW